MEKLKDKLGNELEIGDYVIDDQDDISMILDFVPDDAPPIISKVICLYYHGVYHIPDSDQRFFLKLSWVKKISKEEAMFAKLGGNLLKGKS